MRFCTVDGAESFWCEVERNLEVVVREVVVDVGIVEGWVGSSRRRRR
jgi:hypothetical protein